MYISLATLFGYDDSGSGKAFLNNANDLIEKEHPSIRWAESGNREIDKAVNERILKAVKDYAPAKMEWNEAVRKVNQEFATQALNDKFNMFLNQGFTPTDSIDNAYNETFGEYTEGDTLKDIVDNGALFRGSPTGTVTVTSSRPAGYGTVNEVTRPANDGVDYKRYIMPVLLVGGGLFLVSKLLR
jgi:hypothetical protein